MVEPSSLGPDNIEICFVDCRIQIDHFATYLGEVACFQHQFDQHPDWFGWPLDVASLCRTKAVRENFGAHDAQLGVHRVGPEALLDSESLALNKVFGIRSMESLSRLEVQKKGKHCGMLFFATHERFSFCDDVLFRH